MNTAIKDRQELYREQADTKELTLIKLNGKTPLEAEWPKIEHRNYNDLNFQANENAGIITGKANGIIVLDIDNEELFKKALVDNEWGLPDTYTVQTGSGGHHYYFGYPEDDDNDYRCRSLKGSGFDIRANGGHVVAPGSIHPITEKQYVIEKDMPYNDAPQWLLELSKGKYDEILSTGIIEPEEVDLDTISVVPAILDKIRDGVPEGQRSEAMWNVMLSLMSAELSDGQILTVFNENPIGDKGREKEPEWMSEQILKARENYREHTRSKVSIDDLIAALEKSEQGDADIFKKLFGDKYCYDCTLGKWFKFNGITWGQDTTNEAFSAVGKVAEEYKKHAFMLSSRLQRGEELEPKFEGLIKEFNDKSSKLNTASKRTSILTLARSGNPSNSLGIYGTEWNTDPWILGCTNGVIDLKTGQLREGRPQDYIRIVSPVTWEGIDESAPIWEGFINSIFDNDEDLIEYMQRLLGYSILGQSTEHVMPVLWGKGRNGKSTMFNCLESVLGSYTSPIPSETLLNQSTTRSAASHTSHLFLLKDRRLVWTSEINDGRYFDASVVKSLTGGDKIVGRKAYSADAESFTPTHTIMMLTNSKPRVKDANDYALFQRLHLIPFGLSFIPNPKEAHERKADPELETKLKKESSGILAWLVRGCLKYQEEGSLRPPKIVTDATNEYQREEDVMGLFVESCCESKVDEKVKTSEMYAAYKEWCVLNGHFSMSSQKFHGKMNDRFAKRKSGVDYYLNVQLVAVDDAKSFSGDNNDF